MNTNLPITNFRSQILDAVENHRVLVITAETGAGKSTQVPQYLADAGYQVVVTQPRILAARSVAERVAEEMGVRLGGRVGYRTGFERMDSSETQVLFATDGLQLVREITGSGKAQVLVIDEVHEWNLNIETLVAWARKRLSEEAPFKVVLMSATLEADKLAAYFAEVTGECPVISVPGRLFPVEKSERDSSALLGEVQRLVREGRNTLVFQPGKREIEETVRELAGINAIILPLHGELSPEEQRRVFKHYDLPKVVVSTNVAQTSVTIDDIDAVVDSGLERRIELVDGVEGLYLKPTSQADCEQRAGRAGRTKAGVYVLCSSTPRSNRSAFPQAEILRTRLDQMVLRLADAGIDAAELTFFHNPDHEVVLEAKRTSVALGFMTSEGGVTSLGRKASKLPVGVKVARMVLEGVARGVVDDVVTIAAIMEVGSLKARSGEWRQVTQEEESDALAELDLFQAAQGLSGQQMAEVGIFAKMYFKAKDLRAKLSQALRGLVKFENGGTREDIIRSVTAGMVDHLYQQDSWGGRSYKNGGGSRELAKESVLNGYRTSPDWLVGQPFDLQIQGRRGPMTLHLITWATKVDPSWLVEVAPQLATSERRNYRFDTTKAVVVCDLATRFNGQEIKTEVVEGNGPEAVKALANALVSGSVKLPCVEHNQKVQAEVSSFNNRLMGKLGTVDFSMLTRWYEQHLGEVYTVAGAQELDLYLSDEDVESLLGKVYSAEWKALVLRERPDVWQIGETEYALEYHYSVYYTYDRYVKMSVPMAIISGLTLEQLPSWEGVSVRVYVADEGYTDLYAETSAVAALTGAIETRRQDIAWKAFKATHGDYSETVRVQFEEQLPEDAAPEVWDSVTGSLAFSALEYNSMSGEATSWYRRWFRTEEEATQKRSRAQAAKVEKDREMFETRNFENLKSQAQTLFREVESLWAQVDRSQYQLYGLTSTEAGRDWYSTSIESKIGEAKTLAGLSYYRAEPTKAIELLTSLKERIEAALAQFAANTAREPEAREMLEKANDAANEIGSAYGLSIISWDDMHKVDQQLSEVREAVDGRRYVEAIEKAEALIQRANEILQAAEGARQAAKLVQELVEREYTVCPVCGAELSVDSTHWCNTDLLVSQHPGTDEYYVKESLFQGARVVYLEAVWSSRYSDYKVELKVDRSVHPTSLEEVETFTRVHLPSQREMEITQQKSELQNELKRIEQEKAYVANGDTTRIILQVRQEPHPKTKELQWVGGNRTVKYVVNDRSWVQPSKEGERWICTIGRTLVETPNFRLILVNPQVRIGREREIREEIQALETELAYLQVQEAAEAEEPATAPEAAQEIPLDEAVGTETADTLSVEDAAETLAAAFGKKVKR